MNYTVPEYYSDFSCKGGACRHSCCHGWGITLSMEEYYRLLGIDCSPSLRRRLDTAFYRVDDPSPDRFARVNLRYDGDCPLHADDGLCELHREKGEDVIPSICRMYPRCVREGSCVCTLSCEGVLELIWECNAPLSFCEAELDITPSYSERGGKPTVDINFIRCVLGDASRSVAARLAAVYGVEYSADVPCFDAEREILCALASQSDAVKEFVLPVAGPLLDMEQDDYKRLYVDIESTYPCISLFFANAFINHFFFTEYDRHHANGESFLAVCQLYAMIKLTSLGAFLAGEGKTGIIDRLAGLFRFVEHTAFYGNTAALFSHGRVSAMQLLSF